MNVYRAASAIIGLGISTVLVSQYVAHEKKPDQPTLASTLDAGAGATVGGLQEGADQESLAETGDSRFVEQELEDIESPFTRETVLALNAIVERSLSAINEFDDARKQAEATSTQGQAELLAVYQAISERAALARRDMAGEGNRMLNSGEQYNQAIFAAMVHFVEQVDDEVRREIETVQVVGGDEAES